MKLFVKIFFVFCCSLSSGYALGQNATIEIKGKIDNDSTGAGLGSVKVQLYDIANDSLLETVNTLSNGKYKFKSVPMGGIYKIRLSKNKFVGKFAILDLSDFQDSEIEIFPLEINSNLFIGNEIDYSIMQYLPIAIAKYDKTIDNIIWDIKSIDLYKKNIDEIKSKK